MQHNLLQTAHWCLKSTFIMLLLAAGIASAQAGDYRFGYSSNYHYPYSGYGIHDSLRLRQEMKHIGEQMQRQQRQLDEQFRQQQEQTLLLRQQQSTQQQVTAMQACYYRFNGGLDLCDRLFEPKSAKHAACAETVVEMNPGCAADLAGPAIEPGR